MILCSSLCLNDDQIKKSGSLDPPCVIRWKHYFPVQYFLHKYSMEEVLIKPGTFILRRDHT